MKIVVINLASENSRRLEAMTQFVSVGLHPRALTATPGHMLDPAQRRSLYSEELNRRQFHTKLTDGEIGCYASHCAAWEQLIDSGEHALAVFEDDILIDADMPAVLQALDVQQANWDVVKLMGRQREKLLGSCFLTPARRVVTYRRVPSLTGAYVISAEGAAKLLATRRPFGRPVDVDLRHWWECDIAVRGVQPYPVRSSPSSEVSTIGERRVAKRLPDRLKKLYLQGSYTLRNWHANLTHERGTGVLDVSRPMARGAVSSPR